MRWKLSVHGLVGMLSLVGSVWLVSCSVLSLSGSGAKVWLTKATFQASGDMNDTSALSIHLVVAFDKATFDALSKMSAQDYFKKTEDLQKNDPNNDKLQIWDVELIPGQTQEIPIQTKRMSNEGGFVFANYAAPPGDHRLGIGPQPEIIIQCEKEGLKIAPSPSK
jgi:hypothetical protein